MPIAASAATNLPPKALIGMVHVGALPGSPGAAREIANLAAVAAAEARIYRDAGFHALIIENMHDAPYVHGPALGPETVAAMTAVGLAVRDAVDLPLGVQILSGGASHAVAVALAIGAGFVRVENFVFSHVADEGLLERAEAGPLLRYRRTIGADHVAIFADIKKKHASHALTADVPLEDAAEAAIFFGADGIIITGAQTGRAPDPAEIERAKVAAARSAPSNHAPKPVLIGSGVTPNTVAAMLQSADALIIGSAAKASGHWTGPVDPAACRALVRAAEA